MKNVRIGLIRHFPVEVGMLTGWRTARELQAWRESYDISACSPCEVDLGGIEWKACLSSDMPRTLATAKAIYPGTIEETELLREAEFAEFKTGQLRLPMGCWRWVLRITWMTGHSSQKHCRDEFRRRVERVASDLERRQCDVLVVSHAGMLVYLSRELRKRGFEGPKLRVPENSKLYLYERRVSTSS